MRRRLVAALAAAVATCATVIGTPVSAQEKQPDRPGTITAAETGAAPETLSTASVYFDRARQLGFLAAGTGPPYVLRAEFTTRGSSGAVESGTYTDTWVNDTHWRREAVLHSSRFVRSQNGKKRYRLEEGPDAALLQFVLTAMEPIPPTETFQESNWTISRDLVDRVQTVRVATTKGESEGKLDPKKSEAYWFDEMGQLVSTSLNELQTRRSRFEDFNGIRVARRVEIVLANRVAMRMDVTSLGPADHVNSRIFVIKKHDWMWPPTSEVR